ncbi:MAG: class II aldolase/adducin family protein [Mycobacterium sp.]
MFQFWSERQDLAATLRWAARLNMQEDIDNHFSLAVPDEDGRRTGSRYLVNPWGLHWSEITASSLLLCNYDGTVLEGDGEVESSAMNIHAPVHRRVPDSPAVLHTHAPYATALGMVAGGRVVFGQQNAALFWENIAYDDHYDGVAIDHGEGERLADILGAASVLLLSGHGVITVGSNLAEAFCYMYLLERAARVQVLAASTGGALLEFPKEVLVRTAADLKGGFATLSSTYFEFVKRTLAREEPEYLD